MSVCVKAMIATKMQPVTTTTEVTFANVRRAMREMERIVQMWMSVPHILITATPMQHAKTRMVPLIAPVIQDSLAREPIVLTLMNAQHKLTTVHQTLPVVTIKAPSHVLATQDIQEMAQHV